jgi:hypothetical protein
MISTGFNVLFSYKYVKYIDHNDLPLPFSFTLPFQLDPPPLIGPVLHFCPSLFRSIVQRGCTPPAQQIYPNKNEKGVEEEASERSILYLFFLATVMLPTLCHHALFVKVEIVSLSHPCIQQLSVLLLCYLSTQMQCISIFFSLSFSFPLLPPHSCLELSHYANLSHIFIQRVIQVYICKHEVMFVFVCVLIEKNFEGLGSS